ncbi:MULTISPECIES: histone-like nucleoid-structuring protein Lsr2 [unclassified Brevibacterium]|uniref:Lsr2 dimerization domain-containing protein n=1 Tax=unclassified Brevibacterium TaxID=2614124 RepID=UPI0008A18BBA|nr:MULTISPECIES: histone-like nucleoid-structuring protein Lsr2 [unclassified Brevibacterium]OFS27413.1 hypothetical protein HMPREF3162_02020 [Brevibacterium sp. HMSC07C04]
MTDDLDGSAATSTVEFALDDVTYEIDLNDKNAQKLRDEFAAWAEHVRRVEGRARRGASRGRSDETKRIREWAQARPAFARKSALPRESGAGWVESGVVGALH